MHYKVGSSPKISIIVPVYNLSKYIEKGVNSLLSQTFTDYEIILINDGSTDNSREICDKMSLKSYKIKVFHKENGGVSSARNLGLTKVRGLYTIHMDGDDFVEPTMLEDMYLATEDEKNDIIISDFWVDNNNTSKSIKQRGSTTADGVISDILNGTLHGSVCNKLVRTSLYKKNNIKFKEDIIMCEDLLFNVELLLHASSVTYTNKAHLHYVNRKESCVNSWSNNIFESYHKVIQILNKLLTNENHNMSLMNLKNTIKRDLLHHANMNYTDFKMTYSESIKYIINHPTLSLKSRIFLFLANQNIIFYNILRILVK